jgi:hypothetical protein
LLPAKKLYNIKFTIVNRLRVAFLMSPKYKLDREEFSGGAWLV